MEGISVKNMINQLQKFTLLRILIFIVIGCLVVFKPKLVFTSIIYTLAAYLLLIGLLNLFQAIKASKVTHTILGPEFITACMYFLFTLIVLIFSKVIISMLPFVLGILIVLNGLVQLTTDQTIKEVNPRYRLGHNIYSVIIIIAGVLLIFNPFSSIILLFRVFGGTLIFIGVSEAVRLFMQNKKHY